MGRVTFVLLLSIIVTGAAQRVHTQAGTIAFQEVVLRRSAVTAPMPAYPAVLVARGTSGVAVVSVVTDVEGRVVQVRTLETPDPAIGAAVEAAVRQWTFTPAQVVGRGERYGVRGKLTFYFRIANGRGRVVNPQDMPGGPQLPPGPPPSGAPGVRPSGPPSTLSGAAPVVADHGSNADIEIGESGLQELQRSRPVLLDIQERDEFARGHRDAAVNIPRDELLTRAGIELDVSRPVVIDCARLETRRCHEAARTLLQAGKFARVFVLLP